MRGCSLFDPELSLAWVCPPILSLVVARSYVLWYDFVVPHTRCGCTEIIFLGGSSQINTQSKQGSQPGETTLILIVEQEGYSAKDLAVGRLCEEPFN